MNSNSWRKNLVALLLMAVASGATYALRPTQKVADLGQKVELEQMIPGSFGTWRIDPSIGPLVVSPEVQAKLDKIYNQTLSRTYVNDQGQRIMLSIAYGGDQSDSTQLHRPEVCYVAQGFQVHNKARVTLDSGYGRWPVTQLMASQGRREEPITYWISIGNTMITSHLQQKLVQLRYGLRGLIPDGFLVRISAITDDHPGGYALEQQFARDMLGAMTPADRERLSTAALPAEGGR